MTRDEITADPAYQETIVQLCYDEILRAHKRILATVSLTADERRVVSHCFKGYKTSIRNILHHLFLATIEQIEQQDKQTHKQS